MMREWWSAADLARLALPGLPGTAFGIRQVAAREDWCAADRRGETWRRRPGKGGGVEYHLTLLPLETRRYLARQAERLDIALPPCARADAPGAQGQARWGAAWDEAKVPARDRAAARLEIIQEVEQLIDAGFARIEAITLVASRRGVAQRSIHAWFARIAGVPVPHRWAALIERHAGGRAAAACDEAAWKFYATDYLRPERPTHADCYRRLQRAARAQGWTIPSAATLARRIEALEPAVVALARGGEQALKRMYPPQVRDRGVFAALEAVNADGHDIDVFVRWPDGSIGRPCLLAFQDIHSGMILSWRIDRTENKELIRLAYGDLVEQWGIPGVAYLDNGRGFASKWISGGSANRFRGRARADDPLGVMTQLGTKVIFVTPYSGQSKPVERAFRDFAQTIAKDPRFAGAYTGNNPTAKPENYQSAAVPFDDFLRVLNEGIIEHNARPGRRTAVCGGRLSFRAAFDLSYAQTSPMRASEEQRRFLLLAGETARAQRPDGAILLLGNRYWHPDLGAHAGARLVVRFDPQALHDDLHVFLPDGTPICAAPCIAATGFNDVDAAREHARRRRAWMRAVREAAELERGMTIGEVAGVLDSDPAGAPAPRPETKVVRLVTHGSAARAPAPDAHDEPTQSEVLFLKAVAMQRAAREARGPLHAMADGMPEA